MAEKLIHEGVESESMLETALPLPLEMARPPIPIHERIDFVLVGNLEPWKAWQIALEAFSQAIDLTTTPPRLKVIGTGTQMDEARKLARDLGISELVDFLGQLPREETWKIVERSRGLLFPSVRDTSGNVVLEAMGLAVPVICFFHQGVGFITDDNCALRIRPDDWANGVQGFRHAIQQLQDSDELVTRMGHAGRRRVLELFTWESKIKRMSAIYQSIA